MPALRKGYLGLELLVQLNLDRFFVAFALGGALLVATWISAP